MSVIGESFANIAIIIFFFKVLILFFFLVYIIIYKLLYKLISYLFSFISSKLKLNINLSFLNFFFIRLDHFRVWLKNEIIIFSEGESIFCRSMTNYEFFYFLYSILNRIAFFFFTSFLFIFFFTDAFQPENELVSFLNSRIIVVFYLKSVFHKLSPLFFYFWGLFSQFIRWFFYTIATPILDQLYADILTKSDFSCYIFGIMRDILQPLFLWLWKQQQADLQFRAELLCRAFDSFASFLFNYFPETYFNFFFLYLIVKHILFFFTNFFF